MRCRRALAAVLLAVAALAGCGTEPAGPPPVPAGTLRVASYDFPENQILAEVYAEAIRRAGLPVVVQHGIGTREVVLPALEQGVVDVVVDYLGTAYDFVRPGASPVHHDPGTLHANWPRSSPAGARPCSPRPRRRTRTGSPSSPPSPRSTGSAGSPTSPRWRPG